MSGGGGPRPPPFTIFTITYKFAVYALAQWADALTLFHLYQYMYSAVLHYLITRVRRDIRFESNIIKYEANIYSLQSKETLVSHRSELADFTW